MASKSSVTVRFLGDAEQLDREMAKIQSQMSKTGIEAQRTGRQLSESMRSASEHVQKTMGAGTIALGTALGGLATGGLALVAGKMVNFVSQARDAAAAQRITEQVIKTTGGAADVTAAQVDNLATSISDKTGVDEEAVHSSENLLLTFTKVRNEAGKGNDIFNQATQAVTDMSAALGQDAKASAIQLGKALGDPIRGLTALQRVGVTFDAQETKQIKSLAQHGNMLGAQKIILRELSREFGGAAAAASDPMQKLGTTLQNTGRQLATALLPILEKAAGFIAQDVLPAIQNAIPVVMKVGDALGKFLGPAVSGVVGFFKDLASGFREGNVSGTAAGAIGDAIYRAWSAVGPVIKSVGEWFTGSLVPALKAAWPVAKSFAETLWNNLKPAIDAIGQFVRDSFIPAAEKLWPILQKVGKIVGILAGAILEAATWIIGKFVPVLTKVASVVLPPVEAILGKVVDAVSGLFDWIQKLGPVWSKIWDGIQTVVSDVWNVLEPIFDKIGGAVSTITGGIGKVASIVGGVGSGVGNAISSVGHLLGFADGGVVPGPKGAPMLAVVHGGERVLSNKQQAGVSGAAPQGMHVENVNITVQNTDPATLTRGMHQGLRQTAFLLGVA